MNDKLSTMIKNDMINFNIYENLNIIGFGIGIYDLEGNILFFNKKALNELHGTSDDYLGRNVKEVFEKTIAEQIIQRIHDVKQKDCAFEYKDKVRLPSGQRFFHASYAPIHNRENRIIGVQIISHDVTDIHNIKQELEQSEEKYRSLFMTAANLITSVDKEGRIVDCNDRIADVLGYSKDEIIGESMGKIIHPDYLSKAEESLVEILSKGFLYDKEYQMIKKDGTIIDVSINSAGLKKDGEYVKTICIINDITQKKQAELEINKHVYFIDRIIDESPFSIWISDEKGTVIRTNKALRNHLNLKNEQIVGKYNVLEDVNLIETGVMPQVESVFKDFQPVRFSIPWKAAKGGGNVDFIDGKNLWIDVSMFPILDSNGKLSNVVCQWIDITKRIQTEEKLIEKEKLLSEAQQIANIGSWSYNIKTGDLHWSDTLYRIYGLNPEKIKASLEHGIGMIHPDDQEFAKRIFENTIKKGEPYEITYRVRRPDGEERYVQGIGKVEKDESGEIIRVHGTGQDITKRVKVEKELEQSNQALIQMNENLEEIVIERTIEVDKLLSQKDEFINQLGHDLKNPLGPIINLLPILDKDETDPKKKEMIKVMSRSAGYMKNLVTKTIELAKLNSPNTKYHFQELNLSEIINNVIDINQLFYQEQNIKINNMVPDDIIIQADLVHIQELINNLLNNSAKYSNDEDEVFISAEEDAESVKVAIKDNGIGMTQDQIDHIFDEFYKVDGSRHDFDSSGLGMPICKRIVEVHGGEIWVESEGVDKGTTVSFTLSTKIKDPIDHKSNDIDTSSKKIRKIVHQGKEILYFDFTSFSDEDFESVFDEIPCILEDNEKKELLILTNISGNTLSIGSLRKTRKIGDLIKPFLKKNAIIGLNKKQEAIINAVKTFAGIDIIAFKSKEDALDWLVKNE